METAPLGLTAPFGEGWEGRVVEGRFPLLERLGGTENCGLYFTALQGMQEAIIQLIATDETHAETDVAQWTFAMSLSHPNLSKVFAAGHSVIDGKSLVYVVGERSSTNLAQTMESGALGADRAREIFKSIADALLYLHGHGVVHGHLNPSNIHFSGLNPRLLLTDLLIAGPVTREVPAPGGYDAPEMRSGNVTAAADIWSLGLTMLEAMTLIPPSGDLWRGEEPEIPASLASPFREIVHDCLRRDPLRRCTLQSIQERLGAKSAVSEVASPAAVASSAPAREKQIAKAPVKNEEYEEMETEAPWESGSFAGSLAHFEESHPHRSRVVTFAFVLIAMIAAGAVLYLREHKPGASSKIAQSADTSGATPAENRGTAPPSVAPDQTSPVQAQPLQPSPSPSGSQEQAGPAPQAPSVGDRSAQPDIASQPLSSSQAAQPTGPAHTDVPSASAVSEASKRTADSADRGRRVGDAKGLVEKRVMPSVSPGARSGMSRPVQVLIRVTVNRQGTVSDASYVVPGPGNYFARQAQKAAQSWKFKPPVQNGDAESSVWMLKFNFGRAGTEVTATKQED